MTEEQQEKKFQDAFDEAVDAMMARTEEPIYADIGTYSGCVARPIDAKSVSRPTKPKQRIKN